MATRRGDKPWLPLGHRVTGEYLPERHRSKPHLPQIVLLSLSHSWVLSLRPTQDHVIITYTPTPYRYNQIHVPHREHKELCLAGFLHCAPSTVLPGYTGCDTPRAVRNRATRALSLIHISEPTRRTPISYAVFCLKK